MTANWIGQAETCGAGWVLLRASWAAVEPERGRYDDGMLTTLRTAVTTARRRGAEPVVVVHAGGLPDWVIARGGWLDPDVGAGFGCYVERLGRACGELLRHWIGLWAPLREAGWYDTDARRAARALVEGQATVSTLLARSAGYGGRPPMVGVVERWARWTGTGLRGRADAELHERLGPDALVRTLLSGRLQPPFALVGELGNGLPAADFVGVIWDGIVRLPDEETIGDDPGILTDVLRRLAAADRPVVVFGGAPAAVDAAEAAGVRVLARLPRPVASPCPAEPGDA